MKEPTIKMGLGNIALIPSKDTLERAVVLAFKDVSSQGYCIGETIELTEEEDAQNLLAILSFSSTASIDVVIGRLQLIRRWLEEDSNG